MFTIALALAHPLLTGIPSAALDDHRYDRFDNGCFAYAVSYSAPGRNGRRRRALVTDVIRYRVAPRARCSRDEGEIRAQLARALRTGYTRRSSVRYGAPKVYTFSQARRAHRSRSRVIDRMERNRTVVSFHFDYRERVRVRAPERVWGRVNPRARVRIVRRRSGLPG